SFSCRFTVARSFNGRAQVVRTDWGVVTHKIKGRSNEANLHDIYHQWSPGLFLGAAAWRGTCAVIAEAFKKANKQERIGNTESRRWIFEGVQSGRRKANC